MSNIEQLKEKSIKDIVQFLIDSGFRVPEDDWFEVIKSASGYIFVLGKDNTIFYNSIREFILYKNSDRNNRYARYIKEKARQRIKAIGNEQI